MGDILRLKGEYIALNEQRGPFSIGLNEYAGLLREFRMVDYEEYVALLLHYYGA